MNLKRKTEDPSPVDSPAKVRKTETDEKEDKATDGNAENSNNVRKTEVTLPALKTIANEASGSDFEAPGSQIQSPAPQTGNTTAVPAVAVVAPEWRLAEQLNESVTTFTRLVINRRVLIPRDTQPLFLERAVAKTKPGPVRRKCVWCSLTHSHICDSGCQIRATLKGAGSEDLLELTRILKKLCGDTVRPLIRDFGDRGIRELEKAIKVEIRRLIPLYMAQGGLGGGDPLQGGGAPAVPLGDGGGGGVPPSALIVQQLAQMQGLEVKQMLERHATELGGQSGIDPSIMRSWHQKQWADLSHKHAHQMRTLRSQGSFPSVGVSNGGGVGVGVGVPGMGLPQFHGGHHAMLGLPVNASHQLPQRPEVAQRAHLLRQLLLEQQMQGIGGIGNNAGGGGGINPSIAGGGGLGGGLGGGHGISPSIAGLVGHGINPLVAAGIVSGVCGIGSGHGISPASTAAPSLSSSSSSLPPSSSISTLTSSSAGSIPSSNNLNSNINLNMGQQQQQQPHGINPSVSTPSLSSSSASLRSSSTSASVLGGGSFSGVVSPTGFASPLGLSNPANPMVHASNIMGNANPANPGNHDLARAQMAYFEQLRWQQRLVNQRGMAVPGGSAQPERGTLPPIGRLSEPAIGGHTTSSSNQSITVSQAAQDMNNYAVHAPVATAAAAISKPTAVDVHAMPQGAGSAPATAAPPTAGPPKAEFSKQQ